MPTEGSAGVMAMEVAFTVTLTVTVTVTVSFTLLPSLAATVMMAVPSPVPVTKPVASTVALLSSLLLQVTSLFVASAGSTVAVNCWLSPTTTWGEEGVTAIEVTFCSTGSFLQEEIKRTAIQRVITSQSNQGVRRGVKISFSG